MQSLPEFAVIHFGKRSIFNVFAIARVNANYGYRRLLRQHSTTEQSQFLLLHMLTILLKTSST